MIPDKIYTGKVKHIEATLFSDTDENLERLLRTLFDWRQNKSNKHQTYDVYITDQYGELIYGSQF